MAYRVAASLLVLVCSASLAASQAVPVRVRISEAIAQGQLIKKVDPAYPPLARQARIQGIVTLRVIVSKTGDVENIQLISGHPMLAPAAIEAVKQWKYQPYLLNGEPVEIETSVQVNFTLADKPPADGAAGEMSGGTIGGIIGAVPAPRPGIAVPQRVRVSSGVANGLLQRKVNPMYPPDARNQHIQGTVVLKALIDKEGNVANLDVASGHPALAPAAIEAVRQWKYKPYLLNGQPVVVETQILVNFTLVE